MRGEKRKFTVLQFMINFIYQRARRALNPICLVTKLVTEGRSVFQFIAEFNIASVPNFDGLERSDHTEM
jgi:hypothetical protein